MANPDNPNNCATCKHKQHPDGGHCYMFRLEPTEPCAQHTSQIHALQAIRPHAQAVIDAMTEITEIVDPWPLGPLEKP